MVLLAGWICLCRNVCALCVRHDDDATPFSVPGGHSTVAVLGCARNQLIQFFLAGGVPVLGSVRADEFFSSLDVP